MPAMAWRRSDPSSVLTFSCSALAPLVLYVLFVKCNGKTDTLMGVQMLAQLLRQNGGCQVTIAAPKGLKMELAKSLDAADTYIELSRESPEAQFEQLKKDNPYGFDIGMHAFIEKVGRQ